MSVSREVIRMGDKIEQRWDGIASVAAVVGLVVIAVVGLEYGIVGSAFLYATAGVLSGVAGYSLHNVVSIGGKK
jgi:hypothetical protein